MFSEDKAKLETLNDEALQWFAQTIASSVNNRFISFNPGDEKDSSLDGNKPSMIIVHGAGSFGHFYAKTYGLSGKDCPPPQDMKLSGSEYRHIITGLAKTRLRCDNYSSSKS